MTEQQKKCPVCGQTWLKPSRVDVTRLSCSYCGYVTAGKEKNEKKKKENQS